VPDRHSFPFIAILPFGESAPEFAVHQFRALIYQLHPDLPIILVAGSLTLPRGEVFVAGSSLVSDAVSPLVFSVRAVPEAPLPESLDVLVVIASVLCVHYVVFVVGIILYYIVKTFQFFFT